MSKAFHFYKYQGTGNDFVLADNRANQYSGLTKQEIATLCHRRFGIGADGLMLLNAHKDYDFEMIYYNADGNPGSMCGNGGRCMVQFAHHLGIDKENYRFIASDGEHEAMIDKNGIVSLRMKDVSNIERIGKDYFLDTGSPHYVQLVADAMKTDVYTLGKAIRNNDRFCTTGTNVNFVEKMEQPHSIFVRTYERGVEDETYSCGTGVTAAALVCAADKEGLNEIKVKVLGGELVVKFEQKADNSFTNIYLCGPAEKVFEGNI